MSQQLACNEHQLLAVHGKIRVIATDFHNTLSEFKIKVFYAFYIYFLWPGNVVRCSKNMVATDVLFYVETGIYRHFFGDRKINTKIINLKKKIFTASENRSSQIKNISATDAPFSVQIRIYGLLFVDSKINNKF